MTTSQQLADFMVPYSGRVLLSKDAILTQVLEDLKKLDTTRPELSIGKRQEREIIIAQRAFETLIKNDHDGTIHFEQDHDLLFYLDGVNSEMVSKLNDLNREWEEESKQPEWIKHGVVCQILNGYFQDFAGLVYLPEQEFQRCRKALLAEVLEKMELCDFLMFQRKRLDGFLGFNSRTSDPPLKDKYFESRETIFSAIHDDLLELSIERADLPLNLLRERHQIIIQGTFEALISIGEYGAVEFEEGADWLWRLESTHDLIEEEFNNLNEEWENELLEQENAKSQYIGCLMRGIISDCEGFLYLPHEEFQKARNELLEIILEETSKRGIELLPYQKNQLNRLLGFIQKE